jgi:UDP-N-acetylglucosamine 2-epimerase (non-hydrolysing)
MDVGPQKTVLCVIGTRPEAIKMAPVIRGLQLSPWARCRVVVTGQHRELVDQMLAFFAIEPDLDLDLMRANQSLVELTSRLLVALDDALERERPALVLAQGDTSTVLATALTSFYRRIPFGHVEAGLRTHRLDLPFPEEANRVIAGHLGTLHFAPTASARDNLLWEGIAPSAIHVTGNTVIDALLETARRDIPIGVELDPRKSLILVTAHRRDSFGEPIRLLCQAIAQLHERFSDIEFLWPVHPNPSIKPIVHDLLTRRKRVHLCEPLPYGSFVSAMKRATVVLTDSGGIQEEAPALGKPVLVLRKETERPESVTAGVARLVGHDPLAIVSETSRLLTDEVAYRSMATGLSPYGDGQAARRIVSELHRFFSVGQALKLAG